jgi:hypothetical protein
MTTFKEVTGTKERLVFKCSCMGEEGCGKEIRLEHWEGDYWFHVVSHPASLWGCLKWWWHHRKMWMADLQLTQADLIHLRNAINKEISL